MRTPKRVAIVAQVISVTPIFPIALNAATPTSFIIVHPFTKNIKRPISNLSTIEAVFFADFYFKFMRSATPPEYNASNQAQISSRLVPFLKIGIGQKSVSIIP